MIKHGKIYPISAVGIAPSHLDPIRDYVTKGIADAKEKVTLHPRVCDIRGAKRHNVEECVIAQTIKREWKPQAVAVGRSLAYVVFKGLAIRMRMSRPGTRVAEEFDARGRARLAPIELLPINRTWKLGTPQRGDNKPSPKGGKRPRTKKYGVRAVGGGVVV